MGVWKMTLNPELDQLLHEHFDIGTSDFVTALKTLPVVRPWAASLTEDEVRLLDDAGFTEDRDAFLAAGTEIAGHLARLAVTAFTSDEVAAGLGVTASRVRQKRLAGELWAIPDGQTWVFPVLQFETGNHGGPSRQIRGLDQVLKALPEGMHPVAVAGFLCTPQPDLYVDRALTPLEWLRSGGDVAGAVAVATNLDWYTA
jgi:hypothetical protein